MTRDLERLLNTCHAVGGASLAAIDNAEKELGVTLPNSYREFLAKYGAVVGQGFAIDGIVPQTGEPPLCSDILAIARRLATHSSEEWTRGLVRIADDGGDYSFHLNTARSVDGECPVVVLGPGRDLVEIAKNFDDFAVRWIKGDVEY